MPGPGESLPPPGKPPRLVRPQASRPTAGTDGPRGEGLGEDRNREAQPDKPEPGHHHKAETGLTNYTRRSIQMFEFQAPHAHHSNVPDHAGTAAAALRAQPGTWGRCFTGRSARYAGQVKAGQLAAFPAGEFEATVEKTADGKHDIYVRYVGGAA